MVRRDDAPEDEHERTAGSDGVGGHASDGTRDGYGVSSGREDRGDLHDEPYDDDIEHHDDLELHDEFGHHVGDEYDEFGDHDVDEEGVIGARVVDPTQRRRRGRTRALVVAAAGLVLVAGLVVAFLGIKPIIGALTESKDYDGPGSGSVVYTVADGDSRQEIADGLQKDDVVKTSDAFLSAFTDHPGPEIQPGQYSLKKQMKAADALDLLRGHGRDVVKVTLREGLWKSEVYKALSKATGKPVADYVKAEQAAKAQPDLLGLPSSAKGNVEGYLFPATYEFSPGTSAADQLHVLVGKSTSQLRELGVDDAQMERTVIIASIVEAEARLDADRPKVARVIENRLAKKMPLQLDSTVSYGVQKRAITTSDAERAAKNGYNTYVQAGLPVGPISNPGAASIKAAQAPAAGPWLYFVTVNPATGETRFAVTDEQHQANVALFQKWCQANPGKC